MQIILSTIYILPLTFRPLFFILGSQNCTRFFFLPHSLLFCVHIYLYIYVCVRAKEGSEKDFGIFINGIWGCIEEIWWWYAVVPLKTGASSCLFTSSARNIIAILSFILFFHFLASKNKFIFLIIQILSYIYFVFFLFRRWMRKMEIKK